MSLHIENNKENKDTKLITDWEDLDMKVELLRGIYSHGFEKPSPIQQKAIKYMFENNDLIAQAQSGTGKTGCFSIGALQRIDTTINKTQILILAPTRELSQQIFTVITSLGSLIKNLNINLLIGGTSINNNIEDLNNNIPHIIIGCPGRVNDMFRRKIITANDINLLILDEADEMLSQGFQEQIYNIFQHLSNNVQVALFSATIPKEIEDLSNQFMRDPIKVLVKTDLLTLEGIQQFYIALKNDEQKYETLKDLFGTISVSQCIIYSNSTKRVQELYDKMVEDNYSVCQIHSNMDKEDRINNFEKFSKGICRVLLSSNLTARGIDIQQVSTVINFDLPKDINTYLHRIGRSGRWGRKGMSINFITNYDLKKMREIEKFYNIEIKEFPEDFANI